MGTFARLFAPSFMAAFTLAPVLAWGQEPALPAAGPAEDDKLTVGSVDFYGLPHLNPDDLRARLLVGEGDMLSRDESLEISAEPTRLLPGGPGYAPDRISYVCCDERGRLAVFVRIVDSEVSRPAFRQGPAEEVHLPPQVIEAASAVDRAFNADIMSGKAREDDSLGHALSADVPETRALQERLVPLAREHDRILRRVLRGSVDPGQRAMAARVLGYSPDKQSVVDDLVHAMSDPAEGVRNDAMRALLVFRRAAQDRPRVPYEPFVALLESPVWTDLNKASAALATLTEDRDPALMAVLRERALGPLSEIARWHSRGHALAGFIVLARLAGLTEEELQRRWGAGEVESVILQATEHRSEITAAAAGPRPGVAQGVPRPARPPLARSF